ncbi:hypothetical protein ACJ72_06360 [Emergomyces africanus]|uniref:Uncharacterized protein n=1 Tax=Emergomyces africanus TaxID=1955775 RepID=A0A1B7NRQ7_9EURO|nr:hypothetical protein ACJ72_06360 [Emergomyces africanus]
MGSEERNKRAAPADFRGDLGEREDDQIARLVIGSTLKDKVRWCIRVCRFPLIAVIVVVAVGKLVKRLWVGSIQDRKGEKDRMASIMGGRSGEHEEEPNWFENSGIEQERRKAAPIGVVDGIFLTAGKKGSDGDDGGDDDDDEIWMVVYGFR